jgi:hypothetical protein
MPRSRDHLRRSHWIVLLLSVAGVAAASQRSSGDARLIADFDGEKAETISGLSLWPYSDEQFGGTSEVRTTLIHPGADGSRGALRISFRITDDFRAPFAGAWAMVGPEGLATDLSAYRGVRFYARSKDRAAFAAGVVRFAGQVIRYATPFEIDPEWTLVELPFEKFRLVPPPGGPGPDAAPLDARDITSIGVSVVSRLRGQFELDIDRVEVYR